MKYKAGDKLVVVGNGGGVTHYFCIGDVVTVDFEGNGRHYGCLDENKNRSQLLLPEHVELYYNLVDMDFNIDSSTGAGLGAAFLWDKTPEGSDYWGSQFLQITPDGQEKLDTMIRQYERSLGERADVRITLEDFETKGYAPHGFKSKEPDEVSDIMQELEDWVNGFNDTTGSDVKEGIICKPKIKLDDTDRMWGGYVIESKPDGGPQEYYDLPPDAVTLNDLIEYKAYNQWLGDTAHLFNIFKAAWRWGIKEGTSKEYDARKFIYSGARLLMHYAGVEATRETLQKMLDDPQFKAKGK